MSAQIRMIDVSANNHPTDEPIKWPWVKNAGVGAVMVKCSEGVNYVNPWLGRDAAGASQAGLLIGYYHFAHPGQQVPAVEAQHALAAIAGLPRELGLALDLEVTEGRTWQELADFAAGFHTEACKVVEHSPNYVNDYFAANLPGFPWAQRQWRARTARPRFQVWAWQESTPIAVPGIVGLTDVGYLHPDA